MKGNSSIIIINRDLCEEWLDVLTDCGIATIGLHSLYQYGGIDEFLNWLNRADVRNLLQKFKNTGIEIEYQLHAVNWLLPRGLFSVHPEWFRTDKNGVRVSDWNLCVSSAEALEYIENSAYLLAKMLEQSSHNYYIWGDDCIGSVCYCEKCSKISGADQNMIIMKHVLKGLKRYDKDAKLAFLSYQDSFGTLTVPPEKDMFLEFAPIDRDHFSPICSENEKNRMNCEIFENLGQIFHGDKHVLEYYLDVSYYCGWKRENLKDLVLDTAVLEEDLKYYKSRGATCLSTFAGFIDGGWLKEFGAEKIKKYAEIVKKYFN